MCVAVCSPAESLWTTPQTHQPSNPRCYIGCMMEHNSCMRVLANHMHVTCRSCDRVCWQQQWNVHVITHGMHVCTELDWACKRFSPSVEGRCNVQYVVHLATYRANCPNYHMVAVPGATYSTDRRTVCREAVEVLTAGRHAYLPRQTCQLCLGCPAHIAIPYVSDHSGQTAFFWDSSAEEELSGAVESVLHLETVAGQDNPSSFKGSTD